jgi:hypothetical protein
VVVGIKGTQLYPKKDPYSIFHPLNRLLRILFLAALFRLRTFLLHLSKRLRHVSDLIPNIKTYVDRRALLSRYRNKSLGSCIYFDELKANCLPYPAYQRTAQK